MLALVCKKGKAVIINKNPVDLCNEKPIANPNVGVNSKIADSVMSMKRKSIQGNSVSRSVHRFTHNIETIETHATIQQQKEVVLIEIDSEEEIMFPDHDNIENDKPDEMKSEENNDMVNGSSCKHSHDMSECNPSYVRNYFPSRSDKSIQMLLKEAFRSHISILELEVTKL